MELLGTVPLMGIADHLERLLLGYRVKFDLC